VSETLAANLERERVAGWIWTPVHDVMRKARMLVSGDPSVCFGMSSLLPTSLDEILGALSRLAGFDFATEDGNRGRSWVSPDNVVEQAEALAVRLKLACERGERVFFGTGHPTGPLEMYIRFADALRERGATIVCIGDGEAFDGYHGGSEIRYICDVACVSIGGDLAHTHSARPMEGMLEAGLRPDLVVGDHGFAGASLVRGIDAVGVVDTNDPALVLAWARGLPLSPILCDDNRPPGAYRALTQFVLDLL
jgi:hypothetical protein